MPSVKSRLSKNIESTAFPSVQKCQQFETGRSAPFLKAELSVRSYSIRRSICSEILIIQVFVSSAAGVWWWGGGNGGAACPFSFYCFQTKHLLRGMVVGSAFLVVIFPFGKTSATEARQTGCGERRCLLVVIFPSGKTSATGAPPVSACEAGGRCRCDQFGNIRLIGMLLECLEGLPVWRVFCWKPLSSSVISPCGKYAHGTAPKQAYRMEKSEN